MADISVFMDEGGSLKLEAGEAGRVKIYDARKSIVMDKRNVDGQTKMEIGRLVKGAYVAHFIDSQTNRVKVQNFIIK